MFSIRIRLLLKTIIPIWMMVFLCFTTFAGGGGGEPVLTSISLSHSSGGTIVILTGSTGPNTILHVSGSTYISLLSTYSNCQKSSEPMYDENPIIRWYTASGGLVGTGESLSLFITQSGSYYATLFCKDWPFNSIGFEITIDGGDIPSPTPKDISGGGTSQSTYKDEAETLFRDSDSIARIPLHLALLSLPDHHFISLYWNSIGGESQIYYELEYSTGTTFATGTTYTYRSTHTSYDINYDSLDQNALVHYFRIRAGYLGKNTHYSNIVNYYTDDYLRINCPKKKTYITFSDVMETLDVWIYDIFNISFSTCKKPPVFF